MSTDREIERLLRKARVTTTPEQDERLLTRAATALPRRGRIRRLLPRFLAAAVMLGIVIGGFTARGVRDASEEVPIVVASAKEVQREADINLTFQRRPVPQTTPEKVTSLHPIKIDGTVNLPSGGPTGPDTYYGEYAGGGGGGGLHLSSPIVDGRLETILPRVPNVGGAGAPVHELYRALGERNKVRVVAGPLVRLDDVTAGLEDDAYAGFGGVRGAKETFRILHRPSPGGEEYYRIPEKPFLDPRTAPLSTFGIDVDSASYANVRRFLMQGQLPPPNAVRIEEMINYFTYDYPQPDGDVPFSVTTEVATCPWNPEHRLVHIGIQGKRVERENIPPRNLVFLLDVSGSMKNTDKLPLVKSAMKLLVGELGKADHVGIVTYAGTSGVALQPTSCSDRPTILAAIERLHAGGSTNAGSGIQLAYEMARKNFGDEAINRVILATDGDFNVGITDRQALEALITGEREAGVFLTVLGVGTGNLKDSQLEMLADKGNGNYAYLDSILEAQKVLVREAGATLVTIAKDVKIQVEFNPKHVGSYRLIGYENRMLAARDFNDDTKDAGEIGAGHSVTALYEVTPPGERPGRPEVDPLRYQETPAAPVEVKEEHSDEIFALKLRYKQPNADESSLLTYARTDPGPVPVARASETFSFASAVATFGMLLRRSEAAKDITFALVEEIAAGALGEDPEGDRAEFLKLVKVAGGLAK